jgi:hypothetical protein
MRIENEFTVDAPADRLWAHLLDVERIAPCMPGAELTETVDDRTWKGKVNVRFGPVSMAFAGTVTMEERDDDAKRVKLHAKGTEQKGKGAANAVVTSWLEPAAGGETLVKMEADITLTGAAAQLSRGLLPEVSRKLTQQFADCLHDSMQAEDVAPADAGGPPAASVQPDATPAGAAAGEPPATASPAQPAAASPPPAPRVAAKPVGGIRLGLSAIWSLIVGFFRRLFGGGRRG